MGTVTVLALCAVVSFGRPALADPGSGTPDQGQSQGSQDQSQNQSSQDQSQTQSQAAQDQSQSQTQTQNTTDRRWEQRFERFSKALNLTDDQRQKIQPLFENEAQQIEAVRSDKTLSRREQRAKVREIHAATQEQIKSYLTDEQLQKWGQFKEERSEQHQDRQQNDTTWRKHSRGGQPMTWQEQFERFSKSLNLTEEQKLRIQPLFEAQDEQVTAVYNDNTVTKADKPAKVQAIHADTEAKIEQLLTPDQTQKWSEWKQQGWDQTQDNSTSTQDQTQWFNHERSHRGNWKQQFNRLNKTVNLTDEQQQQIKSLLQAADRRMQALKHDKKLSKQDKQSAMEDLEKSTWTQIQTFLTPDQLQKLGIQPEPATTQQTQPAEQATPNDDPAPAQTDPTPAPQGGDDGK